MLLAGLTQRLIADAGVSALVGSAIYPVEVPQALDVEKVNHLVTYRVISGLNQYVLDAGRRPALMKVRVEYNAWSTTYAAATAIAAALAKSLDTFRGALPNGVFVQAITAENTHTDGFDEDFRLYRIATDYFVMGVTLPA